MSTGERLPHYDAWQEASEIRKRLVDACEDVVLVGSLRRGKLDVGDIELAVLPKFDPPVTDLFGNPLGSARPTYSALDKAIGAAVYTGLLTVDMSCQGPRRKRYQLGPASKFAGFAVEMYIAIGPENFGNIQVIRTGPDDFSTACVTQWHKGGLMPDYLFHKDGCLWYREPGSAKAPELVKCPAEEHFFKALKMPVVPPRDRTPETVAALRAGKYSI